MTNNILKFKEKINSAKVAVLGLGISNIPLIRFLCECGVKDITAYDKFASPQVISNIEMLKKDNMIKKAVTGEDYLEEIPSEKIISGSVWKIKVNADGYSEENVSLLFDWYQDELFISANLQQKK